MILSEPTPEQLQAIDANLSAGNMIDAIKQYRTATGGSLIDGKEWADQRLRSLRRAHPDKFPAEAAGHQRGIAMVIGAVALVTLAVAAFILR